MKRLDLFLGAIALAAVCMAATPDAKAQENGNRDEYGKIVRGPYETNRFGDNWFIGVGGGVNVLLNDGFDMAVAPSIDANIGKWFTPSVGMRVGYQGFQSKLWADTPSVLGNVKDMGKGMYERKLGYMYVHGDFLWNMSDALSGYKETRFWNLVPYLHAGFYRSYGIDDVDFADNEMAAGAGLLHNLRLAERLDLIIDMRATVVNGRVIDASGPALLGSVTAGLAVDLGYPAFVRTSTVLAAAEIESLEQIAVLETAAAALEVANAALAADNRKLVSDLDALSAENKRLKQRKMPECDLSEIYSDMAPAVYFEIGKTELSSLELQHLQFIAESIIAKADDMSQIVITVMGTADNSTGTTKRNKYLSETRGKYVYDILVNEYGIDTDKLVLSSEIVSPQGNPEFDRAVVFNF